MSFSVDAFQDLERLLVERAARSFPVKGSCTVVNLRTCAKAAIRASGCLGRSRSCVNGSQIADIHNVCDGGNFHWFSQLFNSKPAGQ